MPSEEEHDGERRDGEQKAGGAGEAPPWNEDDGWAQRNGDGPSSAVQHEDKLTEGWPQIELERDRGLVVCTIDAQLLNGGL